MRRPTLRSGQMMKVDIELGHAVPLQNPIKMCLDAKPRVSKYTPHSLSRQISFK